MLFRPPSRPLAPLAASLLASLLLGGCSTRAVETTFAPACPRVSILADAADLTRFRTASSRDLTDMVLDGRMTGVGGTCERGDEGQLVTTVRTAVELTRGPAARGRKDAAPLFLAVTRNGQVLDKRIYRIEASFPANTDRIQLTSDEVRLVLPVSATVTGAAYDIYVGFQASPTELATNRARGPR